MGVQGGPHIGSQQVTGLIWAETVISLIFVAIRIAFKKSIHGPTRWVTFSDVSQHGFARTMVITQRTSNWLLTGLDWDDLFIVLAWIALLAQTICYSVVMRSIWDLMAAVEHPLELTAIEIVESLLPRANLYLRVQFASIILFWTQLWLVKAAFLAYYRQLFARGFVGWQKQAWWWLAGLCALTYVVNWPLQFLSCQPLSNYFVAGRCTTARDLRVSNASLYYAAAADILCDFLIMVLPMTLLKKLRTRKTVEKVTAGSVFGAALLIVALAALRLIFTTPGAQSHVDPRWLTIWSMSECSMAVVVAAGPAFAHILRRRRRSEQIEDNTSHGSQQMTMLSAPPRAGSRDTKDWPSTRLDRHDRVRRDVDNRDVESDRTSLPSPERAQCFEKYGYSFD